MSRRFILLATFLACTIAASAQTDVSQYFLQNFGFDSNFDYSASSSQNVAQELKDVPGWTTQVNATYTIIGVYEFGFQGTFNKGKVPEIGYDGEAGGGLAISTGWGETFLFYQEVSLPAGTYTIKVPTYNGKSVTLGTSQLAWIPSSGTSVKSTVSSYPANQWTLDQITFTLTRTTKGKIQIGYKAGAGPSDNSANLVIDYVQLLATDMAVDKSELESTIKSATDLYGDGSKTGAEELKAVIDKAQGVYDDEEADMVAVLAATAELKETIDVFRKNNISEDNPLDCTDYITNPSFESNGSAGWVNVNMKSQTNSSFKKKAGQTYMEKWIGSGNRVGDASISQVLAIPMGKYKLTVAAQNYNEANTTQRCTGAYIYAGDQRTTVYTPADYSVVFTHISSDIEIGFKAENASGNWLAVDNFRLDKIGEIDVAAVLEELQRQITEAEALQNEMMSSASASALQQAIDAAKNVTESSATEEIQSCSKNLYEAKVQAELSVSEYAALQTAIDAVEKDYDSSKEGADDFNAEIEKAKTLVQDGNASSEELAAEIPALETARLLFLVANSTGTPPSVTTKTTFYIPAAHGALIRGTVSGSNIIERGVCWSTEQEPTIADNRSTDYYSQKGMLFHVKTMQPASVYYARVYAINSSYAVGYGDVMKIVTLPVGSCVGTWNNGAPTEEANERCRKAIQETMDYLNEWTAIKGFHLTGNYGADTPTADCSYGGWMRIGPNAGNQAIGTVIHETGHGVGVGTTPRWSNCADTRENTTWGKWLGSWANKTLRFLENTESEATYWQGDGTHGWGANASYDWLVNGADKDTHQPIQYIGGCAILYSLYIDGLCPTDNYKNGVAGYTFNFNENKKYYLKCEDEDPELNDGFLYQRTNTAAAWGRFSPNDMAAKEDSVAWHIEFEPLTGYYRFRNVQSNRYLTHASTGNYVTMKNTSTPSSTENFQLMPGRNVLTIGPVGAQTKLLSYWFTWVDGNIKSMSCGTFNDMFNYGPLHNSTFSYSNSAKTQRFVILSEEEYEKFQEQLIATGVQSVTQGDKAIVGNRTVVGIYTADGTRMEQTKRGINIIRYSDGTSKKIMVH